MSGREVDRGAAWFRFYMRVVLFACMERRETAIIESERRLNTQAGRL